MAQLRSLSLVLMLTFTVTNALSLPLKHAIQERSTLAKRSPKGRDVGIGFGITISIVVFGIFVFYLGVQRGRKGTWYCWRDIEANTSTHDLARENSEEQRRLKARISCPLPISSSAPVELSPVEAPRASRPAFLELHGDDKPIYEMGQPSPRRPSWFDRRSWFRGDDNRRSRPGHAAPALPTARRNEKERSLYEVSGESAHPPAYTEPARPEAVWAGEEQRRSSGAAMMDWSGLEYLRRMYAARKSMHKSGS